MSEGRISVVSAGTGLGQAFLIPERNGKFIVMDSEGGHCDFSPRTRLEAELLFFLQKKYSRVSIERVLSGFGLLDIYGFLKLVANEEDLQEAIETVDSPATIVERAIAKTSPICEKTLKLFVSLYGALAGKFGVTIFIDGRGLSRWRDCSQGRALIKRGEILWRRFFPKAGSKRFSRKSL